MNQHPNSSPMHISLYVGDVAKTQQFYDQLFESAPSKVKPGYLKYELANPNLIISFVQHPEKAGSNFGHLGWKVASSETLQRYLDLAQKAGLEVLEEKETDCCYARQQKFWVSDPDGYRWEVYHFIQDVEQNDAPKLAQAGISCC